MPVNINDFHFIRPELLLLLIPAALLLIKFSVDAKKHSAWQNVISPHLLEFLFVAGKKGTAKSGFWLMALIALVTIIAVSGPSFRQKSVPVFQTENAQVILLDLSLSMDATDIKPSRLERAKFKLLDLLEQTKEGTIALVVYAGDAFVISPLTSDAKTIANMVPTLTTGIMPVLGSRPDLAIQKSVELLENAKYNRGQIIWLTDGVDQQFVNPISQSIQNSRYGLSILAIGTEQGAPIPLPDKSGFLKDRSGSIVVPKLQTVELNEIANATDAGIIELTADNRDIQYLKEIHQWQDNESGVDGEGEQLISRWIDDGYWLVWIVLFLFLIKMIRQPAGQTLSITLVFLGTSLLPNDVQAIGWQDLWLTKNQQAEKAFEEGEYETAANLYENQEWKAAAHYKNGAYSEAASAFDPIESERSLYNHATSLAKANHLQEALDSYNQLLENNPDHQDAAFNKKIIEDLLKQQEQQQQQNEQNSDQENQEQQSQDQQQQDQQQSDQESEQQQQQDQQQMSQEESEQQEMEVSEDQRDKSEKDQALEHWLQKIPDDPGGLLRRKMYREYQRRGRQQKEEKLW